MEFFCPAASSSVRLQGAGAAGGMLPLGLPVVEEASCLDYYLYNIFSITADLLLGFAWLYSAMYMSVKMKFETNRYLKLWKFWWWFNAFICGTAKLIFTLMNNGFGLIFIYQFVGHVGLIVCACLTLLPSKDPARQQLVHGFVDYGSQIFDDIFKKTLWKISSKGEDRNRRFLVENWSMLRRQLFRRVNGTRIGYDFARGNVMEDYITVQIDDDGNIINLMAYPLDGRLMTSLYPSLLDTENADEEVVSRRGSSVDYGDGSPAGGTRERKLSLTGLFSGGEVPTSIPIELVCRMFAGSEKVYYFYGRFDRYGLRQNTQQRRTIAWLLGCLNGCHNITEKNLRTYRVKPLMDLRPEEKASRLLRRKSAQRTVDLSGFRGA